MRLIVGGNKPTYDGPVSTATSDLTTAKLHWNSVLSTPDGKYFIMYVNNLYLINPMKTAEFYRTAIKTIPQEIIDKYDLNNKQSDGYTYIVFEKLIYVLVQAEIISHEALKEHLKPYGYAPARITQALWTHQNRDINLTLVVDNFGIRYINKKDADQLISALQAKYEVTQDWKGGLYCVITIKWDYKARQMDISMSSYMKDALHKFQHTT